MSKLIVERLAVEFGFNVEEAMDCLKTKVKVPFVKVIEGQCDGLKMNGGLFTQCTNKPMATGELCKTCQKQADASGKPTCGLASEREAEGEAWRDPKGRAPVAFGKVMQKEGLNQEVVEREMTRLFGKGDYNAYFVMPEKKTTKKAKKEDGEKKQRGRPKKNKEVVALAEGDDLIATLIAQARTESDGVQKVAEEETTEKPVEEETKEEAVEEETTEEAVEAPAPAEKPKKVKKAKLTEEEKAAAKQAKADAKAAAKEEAKAAKAAEKAAAKEEAKQAKLAEKEAAKAAKAAAKEEAKKAKAAEKKTTKKTKKTEVVEEPEAPVEELTADSPVEEVQVRQVTLGDVEYLMDQENTVYDLATQEPIGVWDEATQTIVEEEVE